MFRIIRFEIDKEALIDVAESRREAVQRIQDLGDIQSSNGVFYTKAMATTSADYFVVEQTLRSLFGDGCSVVASAEDRPVSGKWVVCDYSDGYKLLRTRAPQAYDYGYVVEVGTMQGEFGEERLVAMPKDRVEYQSGRYSSGMYTPVDCS